MCYVRILYFQTLLITFPIIKVVYSQQSNVAQKFIQFNYVRDGILQTVPNCLLGVTYGNVQVNLGNVLNDVQIVSAPNVTWACNSQKLYTLVLFDPDAKAFGATPQRPFLHWFVANIRNCDVSTGTIIAAYQLPTTLPPPVLHRYTFLMWEQRNTLATSLLMSLVTGTVGRFTFSVAATNRQIGSNPMYGNFFQGVIINLASSSNTNILNFLQ